MITTTFSAKEAKNNFGRLLDEARHSPVAVEKNGRRVAVVMSIERYNATQVRGSKQTRDDLEREHQRLLWQQMEREADEDIRAGRISKGYSTVASLMRALNRHKR